MKSRSWWLSLGFGVLTLASCGFPSLPKLGDAGNGSDDPTSDNGQLALVLLAGNIGGEGNLDRPGVASRFKDPSRVAVDSAGNLYVADTGNHIIRKITAAGVVTTLAGTARSYGSTDGAGTVASFNTPAGLAVDSAGNVYVADSLNHTIRKITPAGFVSTLAGAAGLMGSVDGSGATARFQRPVGVAVDSDANVYVADGLNRTIRKITATGAVTTLAGAAGQIGSADGTSVTARFGFPNSVAVDSAGTLYVGDSSNATIRKVTAAGVVTTLAGTAGLLGNADGAGNAATFRGPSGVAVDSAGNVYVADLGNSTIRKITATGFVTTLAGTAQMGGSADGAGPAARFSSPQGVAVDSVGNVYVADTSNDLIRKVTADGVVTTLAGAIGLSGYSDGVGPEAIFSSPAGVAVGGDGTVYVADGSGIRKVTISGVVTTQAITPGPRLSGLAVDSAGNHYLAEPNIHIIRKITAAGEVTTLAGTAGMTGSADGEGPAARFIQPAGIALDSAGNLYVADRGNSTIRKITATGATTTLAGRAGMSGRIDGVGAAARFYYPHGLAIDSAGNLYVGDESNNAIRKITPEGAVTTLAGGSGSGSADGEGNVARFYLPAGVALDSTGNVYVADRGNNTIRKVTPTGVTTTIAGTVGVKGIGLGAIPNFSAPDGLAIIGDSIVISDPHAILLLRHGAR